VSILNKKTMHSFTPYQEQSILYEALVEAVGAVKAQQILEKKKYEYAMIQNSSNIEIR
jgi:hypothetical protein